MTNMYTADDRNREDERRAPLNGYELVASVQIHPDDKRHGFIVLLDRNVPGLPQRYVTGWVKRLDDPTWNNGRYHATYGRALGNMVERWYGHAVGAEVDGVVR